MLLLQLCCPKHSIFIRIRKLIERIVHSYIFGCHPKSINHQMSFLPDDFFSHEIRVLHDGHIDSSNKDDTRETRILSSCVSIWSGKLIIIMIFHFSFIYIRNLCMRLTAVASIALARLNFTVCLCMCVDLRRLKTTIRNPS